MLLERIQRGATAARSSPLSLDEWASYFNFNGLTYPLTGSSGTGTTEIAQDFRGYVEGIYKANGVVFACMLVRSLLFSEARFQFRRITNGRPGDLFGTGALARLERPWPNGTTGDLLTRAIQDIDLAGNFYARRTPNGVERLRPDWVTIMLGNPNKGADVGDLGTEVLGYSYQPGGPGSGKAPVGLLRDEVAHVAPIPDPTATYRGMSWLTPIVREVMSDGAATTHKQKFFENGAMPGLVVSLSPDIQPAAFERFKTIFEEHQRGYLNAYETLFLGGGADAKVVTADLKQLDFKVVQGAGETRIAAAAGVPPVIVGLSEGLQAATYSNYSQARRRFADGTMRPLWRNFAGSMATIVDLPPNAELWYDDRDIAFLREDQKDTAEIQASQSAAIKQLVDAGYDAESVVKAVTADDLSLLEHTGLFSVQLQPPGTTFPGANGGAPAGTNGAAAPTP